MKRIKKASHRKFKRKKRIRYRIGDGIFSRPRITIFKSNKYFYAQVIDDSMGHTLASASTIERGLKLSKNINDIKKLGKILAERLKNNNISVLVFDRNGYKYCGLIARFADSLRESGIKI